MPEKFSCTGEKISARPLVLLHGWGFDSRIWADIIPALQRSFDVITIDLPCFGNNHFCSSDIDEVAQNIIEQLPERSILLGWSLGGLIATHLAMYFPQRVSALITVGSNLKWIAVDEVNDQWPGASSNNFASFFENLAQQFETTKQHFCGVIARGDDKERALAKLLREKISNGSKEGFLQGLQLLARIDNRDGFSSLAVSGLHLFGERDALVPLDVEKGMHSLNKKQQTKIFSGAAHAPFLSEPELFVTTINNFVQATAYQLDKRQIAESFSKAAVTYDSAAQLQRNIGDQLLSLLSNKPVNTVLDLGSGTGVYSRHLQHQYPSANIVSLDIAQGMLQIARSKISVCADAEFLPFRDGSINLVFSNLAIQWCQNYQQLFSELYRTLAPGGQCVISTFAEGTLKELKSAWQAVDDLTHVNRFAYADSLRESAVNAGFCSIDMQRQSLVRYYATVKELTTELKAIGAHNINSGRPGGLTGKRKLKKLLDAYEKFRFDDKLPAHYEILYLMLSKER